MKGRHHRPQLIASLSDPRIRRIRALRLREVRDRTGLFYTEGIRFVLKAVQHDTPIKTLIVAPELLTNPLAQQLVASQ